MTRLSHSRCDPRRRVRCHESTPTRSARVFTSSGSPRSRTCASCRVYTPCVPLLFPHGISAQMSVLQHFAVPLRAFSTNRSTALIPAFEATHLFGNLDELVPIAEAFASDLERLVEATKRDKQRLPPPFGQVLLEHVRILCQRSELVMTDHALPRSSACANRTRSGSPTRPRWKRSEESSTVPTRPFASSSTERRSSVGRRRRRRAGSRSSSRSLFSASRGTVSCLIVSLPVLRVCDSSVHLAATAIILALPPDDPNVDPLQSAAGLLADVCRMETDDATKRAAVFWSRR